MNFKRLFNNVKKIGKGITIRQRIYWSFSLLVSLFVINGIITIITLNKNKDLSENISMLLDPSLQEIEDFEDILNASEMYTTNWVFLRSNQRDKDALRKLHASDYSEMKLKLNSLFSKLGDTSRTDSLHKIFTGFEVLLGIERNLMSSLQKFEDYDDPAAKLKAEGIIEDELLPRTSILLNSLSNIVSHQKMIRNQKNSELDKSSMRLRMLISLSSVAIIFMGILLSLHMARLIINPVNKIRRIINDLGRGKIIEKGNHKISNDEIGEMFRSVNNLSEKLQKTAAFAHEIGLRNFAMPFSPLSEEDTLGRALITMRDNLNVSETLLEKTNELARIGSWEIDRSDNTLFWSSITKQIHGVSSDFVPNLETALGFYKAGPSRETVSFAIREAIEKGVAFDQELQVVTPNNTERWVRANCQAEFVNGKCIRVYGSFQDIDKRKKAELEVLKVYEEKNIILESIGDAFFAVDKSWVVTYWNNHAEKMLQTPKNTILGLHLWEVFSQSIDSESYRKYHQAIESNQIIRFHDFYEPLDKWFEIDAYPSDNGLSVFIKDITQQRKSEVEREKMTADLIQRNKELEQFSYIISHNLRAPVANILGHSRILQKENLAHDIKNAMISGLSISVNKLDEVIKDLNSILNTRREVNENKKVVSFTTLVKDIEVSIESMIVNEKATILCDFSEVDEMLTIKSYLHSIFYNLISNSLKYRQPDISPLIRIRSQKLTDKIVLFFKDNGLGIDLEKRRNQVFGLYKRFHTDRAEGKGMGLYLVKTQVESIGGTISITSEVNKGTEFKIEFVIKQSKS